MNSAPDPATAATLAAANPYAHLRRTPRFKASDDREITITLCRAAGCEPRESRGRVLDLSAGGAKLAVPCEVALQEVVEVRFDMAELISEVSVSASVCWARTAGGSGWRLGVAFAEELPESLLSQMVSHGYIDRREFPRQATSLAASVQWEATRETSDVQLLDVSAGGFSLAGAPSTAPGSRLRLTITKPNGEQVVLSAVVCWQRPDENGQVLGCNYLEEGAFRKLEGLLPAVATNAAAKPAESPAEASTAGGANSRPEGRPLTVDLATQQAKQRLIVAIGAIALAFVLLLLAPSLGAFGWLVTTSAIVGAAAAANRYQQLTSQVLLAGAEAARNGKLR